MWTHDEKSNYLQTFRKSKVNLTHLYAFAVMTFDKKITLDGTYVKSDLACYIAF